MKKYIMLLLFCILLQGCFPEITPREALAPKNVAIDVRLGVEQEANVGDTLIIKAIYSTYPGFVAQKEYLTPPPGIQPIIKGAPFICISKLVTGEYICSWHNNYLPPPEHINLPSVVINKDGDIVGFFQLVNYKPLEKPSEGVFTQTDITNSAAIGFKRELVYNGKTKDSVKILYREFSGDMIRPAFSQDLIYDLSESSIIGFKDIRIKVIHATNTNIRYEVIEIEGQSSLRQ